MRRTLVSETCLLACLLLLAACSSKSDALPDGEADAAMDADADASDGGAMDAEAAVEAGPESGPEDLAPAGSACTSASQCEGPAAACIEAIRPFAAVPGIDPLFAELGVYFPDGYCSSEPNCASNADCGPSGTCFHPFSDVQATTLRELEIPLNVSAGSLDYLPAYAMCLRACSSAADCEAGQLCDLPLESLTSLVLGAVNETKFCIADPACVNGGCEGGPCSPNPCMHGGTCTAVGAAAICECAEGYEGEQCETQVVVPDRVIGQACTSDAQCDVPFMRSCLHGIDPLMDLVPPGSPLDGVGLSFDRGYCSSEPNCASDVQCGAGGRCFAPFREVTASTLRELEMTGSLATGSLDGLGEYGVCLRECSSTLDCFPYQSCRIVMSDFTVLVPGSVNEHTFCVPHEDCAVCDAHAHCFVDQDQVGSCVCNEGYSGTGYVCTPTGG